MVSPVDPPLPASANAKAAPKATVAPSEARPARTKRAGPVGRSHAVKPRSTTIRPNPTTSSTAPRKKPEPGRQPASQSQEAREQHGGAPGQEAQRRQSPLSENSGFATRTGRNWKSAPHIAKLSQPTHTTCTRTSVSGDVRWAAGKPKPATISASATNTTQPPSQSSSSSIVIYWRQSSAVSKLSYAA